MDILPILKTGKLIAVYAPDAAGTESMTLIAELGLRGVVTILDGGNRYQPYQVATFLRRKTVDISSAANRLFSRRAFTCYEMNTLIGSTPSLNHPCLILDLLNTFYDDHVSIHEAGRLLKSCLGQIQRLVLSGPVVLTLAPPLTDERAFLLEQVRAQADEVMIKEAPVCEPTQPSLF
ncbi:MAG TPA: hypothetical protein PKE62_08410 [Anaerolineales bacterium]|nr:hypothetical protein [Anaerolineales bacterium]HRJ58754.1 hypothetical protein [Anaerolineales bacterium]HRK89177.1 hypothetical protein [Anaerolineales bacterium]